VIRNTAVEVNSAPYDAYWKIVDREQPDVVFTHWPIDNHEDHRADSLVGNLDCHQTSEGSTRTVLNPQA
jgi:LmbE family N-acetylglucosaminyl deacetylase